MPTLSQLAIYPIKSCSQIPLTEAISGPFGLEMDRRLMLVDSNGDMLTQRKHARMCLIHCSIENSLLTVTAHGKHPLIIDTIDPTHTTRVTVWDDSCNAIDCGDEAAKWFSDFLKTSARLVYFPEEEIRQVDLNYANKGDVTAFSDGFPYLLISQASLDDLNSRLIMPIEMKRFRPNLVITGTDAFAEDNWKRFRIGDITFRVVKPCSRCVIPSIDPATARKTAEPVKTLAAYRMRDNKIFFGQNVIAEGTGTLKVGMDAEVLETAN